MLPSAKVQRLSEIESWNLGQPGCRALRLPELNTADRLFCALSLCPKPVLYEQLSRSCMHAHSLINVSLHGGNVELDVGRAAWLVPTEGLFRALVSVGHLSGLDFPNESFGALCLDVRTLTFLPTNGFSINKS